MEGGPRAHEGSPPGAPGEGTHRTCAASPEAQAGRRLPANPQHRACIPPHTRLHRRGRPNQLCVLQVLHRPRLDRRRLVPRARQRSAVGGAAPQKVGRASRTGSNHSPGTSRRAYVVPVGRCGTTNTLAACTPPPAPHLYSGSSATLAAPAPLAQGALRATSQSNFCHTLPSLAAGWQGRAGHGTAFEQVR